MTARRPVERYRPHFAVALFAAGLGGCGGSRQAPLVPTTSEQSRAAVDWRRLVTRGDRQRLRGWRATWLVATAAARGADGGMLASDPALFNLDRAMNDAVPPAGAYRCRMFKLGARGPAFAGFVAMPGFACQVDETGAGVGFMRVDGSQRPVGRLFRDTAARGIFLGTMMLGGERRPMPYGRDARRDVVGVVERIGAQRWRIVLPEPRYGSRLDVIELVPAR